MDHERFGSHEQRLRRSIVATGWFIYWPLRCWVVATHLLLAVFGVLAELGVHLLASDGAPYQHPGLKGFVWRSLGTGYALACLVPFRFYAAGPPAKGIAIALLSFLVAGLIAVEKMMPRAIWGYGEPNPAAASWLAKLFLLPGVVLLLRVALVQGQRWAASAR